MTRPAYAAAPRARPIERARREVRRDGEGEGRRDRQRGAALLVAVLFAASLSVVAGAVAWFATMAAQTSAASRDRADVDDALQAALELAAGALASEPDLDAVRRGETSAAGNGTAMLATADGVVDVAGLGLTLERRRRRLAAPDDVAVWRPYLWGRLGELLSVGPGVTARDPLVAVWVRGDDAAALGADHVELAAEAVGASGARASAVAVVRVGPRGAAILAVWPDGGIAGPG